jgi:hypothetical protein
MVPNIWLSCVDTSTIYVSFPHDGQFASKHLSFTTVSYYRSRNIAVKCNLQVMQVTDILIIFSSKNVGPKSELQLYMGNLRLSQDYFYSYSSPAKLPLVSYPFFPPPFYCALILVLYFLIFNHCLPCLPDSSMLKTETMGCYSSTKLYDNPF